MNVLLKIISNCKTVEEADFYIKNTLNNGRSSGAISNIIVIPHKRSAIRNLHLFAQSSSACPILKTLTSNDLAEVYS